MYKEKNEGKYFCAIVKPDKIVTGIFIRLKEADLQYSKHLIFYKTKANKEEEMLFVKDLVTFKVIENEDEQILHKFGFTQ